MSRRLIIGDIHGEYDRLEEVLKKADFNRFKDTLYSVGDLCDRGEQNVKVLSYLMSLKDFKMVRGNHDIWLYNYLYTGTPNRIWVEYNGGYTTMNEIQSLGESERKNILDFLSKSRRAIYEDTFMVSHGGIYSEENLMAEARSELEGRDPNGDYEGNITWDRSYLTSAFISQKMEEGKLNDEQIHFYKDKLIPPIETDKWVFIGHTAMSGPFINEKYHLINMDTGSGKGGILTLMDIDTKEYWQA